jgi:hypothetical protein
MSYHVFSLDPRIILGVGPGASPDELREAYHAKSKKHHPDVGGDEWAFRLVARAYEVLKATAASPITQRWDPGGSRGPAPFAEQGWAWARNTPFGQTDSATPGHAGSQEMEGNGFDGRSSTNVKEASGPTAQKERECGAVPDGLRRVSVELVWTRYIRDDGGRLTSLQDPGDATLSVCMVISWPPHSLVDRAAEFPSSGETLHTLIELFGRLSNRGSVVGARSRIEDGRFVAWLSYPDVLTAGDAFLLLRETFQKHGLIPKLQTRDILLPIDSGPEAVFEPGT